MKKILIVLMALAAVVCACSEKADLQEGNSGNPTVQPGSDSGSDSSSADDGFVADGTIREWEGETANDASADVVGTDEDYYWEANSFSVIVNVTFSESSAARVVVTDADGGAIADNGGVLWDVQGGYVTLDLFTNSVSGVETVVSGGTTDGGLKIYGQKKFKLTLNGCDITSTKGPAINSQCKKRAFVHLVDGTVNTLTDASSYSDDTYYLNGAVADDEDRKGCFFSEGNLILSGSGVLVVEGNKKHGIATDGYFWMRPGVTVAVTGAAKNALHVKGDADDGIGIHIEGGLFYANVSSTAGKGMKTDLNVDVAGGRLEIYTSGEAEYDEDEMDTSSAACIKTDGDVNISGGVLNLTSTGTGGKGINADCALTMTGGTVNVVTTGGRYVYNEALDLTSSPKGVKADGDIVIDAGEMNITVSGVSDGSEGLESKSTITINGGDIIINAYDDAMNASSDITITGGRVYCYSTNNDGIDTNGTMNVTGGLVIASATTAPEEGFDCDNSNQFKVNGGTLIGTGGAAVSPYSGSSQKTVIYNGLSATKGNILSLANSAGETIMVYELPRTMSSMSLFFSSPDLENGSYTLSSGGTASGDYWQGWYSDGTVSGSSQVGTFTVSGSVTTVGNSGGPGAGGPGGGGSRPW